MANMRICKKDVQFQLDSGASVNALKVKDYTQITNNNHTWFDGRKDKLKHNV